MSSRRFQELRVYQLAERLADDIWKIVNGWESSKLLGLKPRPFGRALQKIERSN
ncbi:S23 ribosomal protein [Nostoc linckia NIES-25]|nr:S23 ribosomal protein [Nostoc linckia NIES-25]